MITLVEFIKQLLTSCTHLATALGGQGGDYECNLS